MKAKNYFLVAFILFFNNLFAQIGIGTTSPDAQLDIRSSNQAAPANNDGILIPKVNVFPATNPTAAQQGMLVYLTTSTTFLATTRQPGFYYWNNPTSDWIGLSSTANGDHDWYEESTTVPPNSITDDMFHTGNVAIGKNTADYPLEVQNTTLDTSVNLISDFNVSNATNKSGINNTITGTTADPVLGINNDINTPNTNFAVAIRNNLITNGNFTSGFYNQISSGAGDTYAISNEITTNSLNGFTFGMRNNLNHSGINGRIIGAENIIATTGAALQYGVNNTLTNTGTGTRYGVNNTLVGGSSIFNQFGVKNLLNIPGGGTNYGVHNTIAASIASGDLIGMYNDIVGASPNNQIGLENTISGSSAISDYGVKNTLNGTGNSIKYGIRNDFNSSGTSINYGEYNSITGSSSGLQYGNFNSISNTGTGDHLGVYNSLTGNGTGVKVGVRSQITSTNTSGIYGVNNIISGGGSSINYGTYSTLFGTSTGAQHGSYTEISNSSTGIHYGTLNRMTGAGNGLKYGIRNELSGNGNQTGSYNILTGTGTGIQIGNYNEITTTNASAHTGVLSTMSGSGAGLKTGIYSFIAPAAGGTHYGVYSEVLKAGSTNFAGYFLGNVGIGTTGGNMYTLPASRGTVGQTMRTDALGNVIWANNSDFAWSLTGNTVAATNFIGTTNAQPLRFFCNNVERMRINPTDGEIIAGGLASPYAGDLLNAVSTAALPFGINGYSAQNGSGTWGEILAGSTTGFSAVQGYYGGSGNGAGTLGNYAGTGTNTTRAGVVGICSGPTATVGGAGVYGINSIASGNQRIGVLGTYNGAAFGIGVHGIGFGGGIIAGNVDAAVVGWRANNANYSGYFNGNHVIANGTKTASVGTSKGNQLLYVTELPEVWFEDVGGGQLINGSTHIQLDPLFIETIFVDQTHPMRIFLQEEGESNGLIVIKDADNKGFTVKEKNGGNSNIAFSYRIMAKRLHFQDHRFGNDPLWGEGDTRKYNQYATPPPVDYSENVKFQENQKRNFKQTPMPDGFIDYFQIQNELKKLELEKPKGEEKSEN